MEIKQFNTKYTKQGGIKQLSNMKDNLETLKKIAEHFQVSKERVRQWMIEFFQEKYDPRYERREKKIEAIKKLIKKYGTSRVTIFYPGINRDYLKTAINSCRNENNE